ncbi:CmpA/NrtA family ABC transporter substrate-binding protein [Tychonema sp. LEGE 07203]|uniref:CmpA/NrtA family ABC transporter substrate-binding protein n=1 Tax=Tychonema sp. LEGE 07203 TaxID=1828671 RepID=UPI00188085CB|nr:CmpA/NrtA family ABC transporter substrate-binding protein [Tychonema sp. LEGE 07203]MBE9096947.1 ABC transporter substrate-binding protein [Tychonema sp. LEGE 07203]
MSNLSRRKFIITAGVTAAGTLLAHGCSSGSTTSAGSSPAGGSPSAAPAVNINPADAPEVTGATLGFIALTDAAPIIIALEKGYFTKYGMKDVKITKQASWPVTRDNLELGSDKGGIDGAHLLTPMAHQMTLGTITKGNLPVPMNILARLNTNGQGISLGQKYLDLKIGTDSKPFKAALANQKVPIAMTFPGGTHDLWIRYWLAAGGINPDTDVSVIPVPPPQMVANMKSGSMEAFCVGEPWNAQLIAQKVGYSALITGELWKDHPEKALTLRADWVAKNPKAAKAITMAVLESQQWCDKAENKQEMCEIIGKDRWLKVPVADIVARSKGEIDYGTGRVEAASPLAMKFWADNASYPYKSHDAWFITENIRWGYIPATTDIKGTVDKVNREDIWKAAATAIGVPAAQIPATTSRGVETFFDGIKFDPEKPEEYLKSLAIKKA